MGNRIRPLLSPPTSAGFTPSDPVQEFVDALEEATRERTLNDLTLTPKG